MGLPRVSTPRRRRRQEADSFRVEKPAEEMVGSIQGQMAKSLPEWYVALALWKLGWAGYFKYQAKYFGGHSLRGGQVLDFLVYTMPLYTVIFVDGDYWHGNALNQEVDKVARDNLRNKLMGRIRAPVVLTGSRLQTKQMAYNEVWKAVGRRQ